MVHGRLVRAAFQHYGPFGNNPFVGSTTSFSVESDMLHDLERQPDGALNSRQLR